MSPTARLLCGDCVEQMATLAPNSIDSAVTDPPYHFNSIVKRFGKQGAAAAQYGTDGAFARASRGFMGKEWDGGDVAFRPETWAAVLRVLKPGGHLLAFGSSKGYHRMACAIEDAGFEIRDTIMWIYGSGFPKSLNVSNAIDKMRTEDLPGVRTVCRFIRAAMDARRLKSRDLVQYFGNCNPRLIDHWAARDTDSQPALPTPEQWSRLKFVLGLPDTLDAEVARLNARKGSHGDAWNGAEVIGIDEGAMAGWSMDGDTQFVDREIKAPNSPEAEEWEGWGTALKPAFEPVIMARKPLVGTVAANVLEHGTGAINIDGCRVGLREKPKVTDPKTTSGTYGKINSPGGKLLPDARWPANIIHDGSDEVIAAFPHVKSGKPGTMRKGTNEGAAYGAESRAPGTLMTGFGDAGSAARFFYCAKASKADRAGSKHPTVKPNSLMRYLCRMVTPPGGTVLDMFAGSGSTGQAALDEGFNAVLIEREPEYQADIRRRLGLEVPAPSFADFMAAQPAPSFADFMAGKT